MKKQLNKDDNSNFSKETFVLKTQGSVASKYLKLNDIAKGSFSRIFRVQNKTSFKVYVVKEIAKEKVADNFKFKNEINILSKVDHPNIVKLYEVFENSRHYDLVMEECTGGELFDRILEKIEKDEAFSEKEAANIFKQLMSAVCYCHGQGICHRDLKPENILFANRSADSPIKIIDFGQSKIFGEIKPLMKGNKQEKNIMSARVGTAYYISPEVLQGNYDHKCDIWSCGVILYILLCGYPPFDGETESDIYKAISKKKFTFPEKEWKGVSDEAKDLIKHMLCEPDKRYNAEMVLNHQWIEKNAPNAQGSLAQLNVNNLKSFKNAYKLKKIALTFIGANLGEKDVKDLKTVFEEMDANKDGTLSIEEIKNGINKLIEGKQEMSENEIIEMFKSIDSDKNDKIEYSEFIAAAMEQKNYLREEKLIDFFNMMDRDGSGKIGKKDIKEFLDAENMENENLTKIIQEFDLDGDGEIDYNEFMTGMNNMNKKEEEIQENLKITMKQKGHK